MKSGFTTDHLIEIRKKRECGYENVILLKSLILKAWEVLGRVNEHLYHEDTHTILENKPIFDAEKRSLLRLDAQVEVFMSTGLVRRFESDARCKEFAMNQIRLQTRTRFTDWNKIATQLNHTARLLQKEWLKKQQLKTLRSSVVRGDTLSPDSGVRPTEVSGFGSRFACVFVLLVVVFAWLSVYGTLSSLEEDEVDASFARRITYGTVIGTTAACACVFRIIIDVYSALRLCIRWIRSGMCFKTHAS